MKLALLVICFSVLSNCSSSGGGGTTPVTVHSGTKSPTSALRGEDVTATYNAASDTFSITIEGRPIVLTSDAVRSRAGNVGVSAFSDSTLIGGREFPEFVVFHLVSSSGNTTATLAAKSGGINLPGYSPAFSAGHFGAGYSRENTTVIPISGSATMNGQYVGVVSGNRLVGGIVDDVSDEVIYGVVALTADFNTGTVNGNITNRVSYDLAIMEPNNNETVADVILTNVSIANDGTYSGNISGGGINRGGSLTGTTGSYSGVISGANGTETAGLLSITHRYTGVPFGLFEEGIFVAQ